MMCHQLIPCLATFASFAMRLVLVSNSVRCWRGCLGNEVVSIDRFELSSIQSSFCDFLVHTPARSSSTVSMTRSGPSPPSMKYMPDPQ